MFISKMKHKKKKKIYPKKVLRSLALHNWGRMSKSDKVYYLILNK